MSEEVVLNAVVAKDIPDRASDGSSSTQKVHKNDLYAAITRSFLRGLALYFSRPARLFRPVKTSGWISLQHAAARDGVPLSPKYVAGLIDRYGISVIPRHFLPPLIINSALGTLLFATYSTVNSTLTDACPSASTIVTAAVSGSAAGFVQALAGAPADNVRSLMERGVYHPEKSVSGWRHAWKEAFRGTGPNVAVGNVRDKTQTRQAIKEIREIRNWVKEVRGMAGRGWEGWGWGCSKDVLGYSLFFATFDVFRRLALQVSELIDRRVCVDDRMNTKSRASTPTRVAQGSVLVLGGVIAGVGYEVVSHPFDNVRREWHIQQLTRDSYLKQLPNVPRSASSGVQIRPLPPLVRLTRHILRTQGLRGLFASPTLPAIHSDTERFAGGSKTRNSRLYPVLRTFARVGPWGIGFLVWQGFSGEIQ